MSMDVTKVRIRGVEVEFNWFDMDTREEYVKANDTLQESLSALDKEWDGIEDPTQEEEIKHFKAICDTVHNFFRDLFGEETTRQIFGDKHDYFACADAIASLVTAKDKQAAVIESIAASPKLT